VQGKLPGSFLTRSVYACDPGGGGVLAGSASAIGARNSERKAMDNV
jgi:hypothetical protein